MTRVTVLAAMSARGELTQVRADCECFERRRVIAELVGWLYPSVLDAEIREIRRMATTPHIRLTKVTRRDILK